MSFAKGWPPGVVVLLGSINKKNRLVVNHPSNMPRLCQGFSTVKALGVKRLISFVGQRTTSTFRSGFSSSQDGFLWKWVDENSDRSCILYMVILQVAAIILWVVSLPSNSGKWRVVRIPLVKNVSILVMTLLHLLPKKRGEHDITSGYNLLMAHGSDRPWPLEVPTVKSIDCGLRQVLRHACIMVTSYTIPSHVSRCKASQYGIKWWKGWEW